MNLSTSRLVRSTPFRRCDGLFAASEPGARLAGDFNPFSSRTRIKTPDARSAISRMRAHSAASAAEFSHCAEQRPGPSNLTLERLREADQITRIASVELDHAARKKPVVGSDEAALRRLPIVRVRGKVDAEEGPIHADALRVQRCNPASQQNAHDALGNHLDAADDFLGLLPLHAPHDRQFPTIALPDSNDFAQL